MCGCLPRPCFQELEMTAKDIMKFALINMPHLHRQPYMFYESLLISLILISLLSSLFSLVSPYWCPLTGVPLSLVHNCSQVRANWSLRPKRPIRTFAFSILANARSDYLANDYSCVIATNCEPGFTDVPACNR